MCKNIITRGHKLSSRKAKICDAKVVNAEFELYLNVTKLKCGMSTKIESEVDNVKCGYRK